MRRFASLLLASWLALLVAEPAALHACAMHATGHGAHVQVSAADDQAHEHEHADHAPVDATTDATDTSGKAPQHCQCLGECCAAAVLALHGGEVAAAPLLAVDAAVRAPGVVTRALRAPDLRLPFAHAPPAPLTV